MSLSASQADRSRPLQTPAGMDVPAKRRPSPPPVKPMSGSEVKSSPVEPEEASSASPMATSSKPEPSAGDDDEVGGGSDDDDEIPPDIIDKEIFRQILDLDDGDSKEFSFEMTAAYLLQAKETFDNMDDALSAKDLTELSRLGHYLKGSSAAVGIWRVQRSCEKIQHYGQMRDEDAGVQITSADALQKITQMIAQAKKDNDAAEAWMKVYYKDEFANQEADS